MMIGKATHTFGGGLDTVQKDWWVILMRTDLTGCDDSPIIAFVAPTPNTDSEELHAAEVPLGSLIRFVDWEATE